LFPETLRDGSIGSTSRVDDRQADRARRRPRGRHEAGKKKPRSAGFKS